MTCLAAIVVSLLVQSDPEKKEQDPPERKVVVTATRHEENPFDLPYSTDALRRDQLLDERLARTLPDALREIPGVMVQKTSPGQGSPFIRGFTGFRTVLLIDGIRLNNSTFREGPNQYWNTVDAMTIERLEVVKGCSSVLYGSDAIGGAVNALTIGPATWQDGLGYGGRTYLRYSSADDSIVARGEVGATYDKTIGIIIGGSWRDFNDIDGGRDVGLQPKTGWLERNGDLKIEYNLASDVRLVVAHQIVNQDDIWRTHRTTSGVRWHGTTIGTDREHIFDQDRRLTYAQIHWQKPAGFIDAVHISASWHEQDEFQHTVGSSGSGNDQGVLVGTLGLWTQLESATSFGRLTYGIEWYRDNVNSFRNNFNAAGVITSSPIQGPVADEAEYALLGLFLQDEVELDEAWRVIAGLRFTHASVKADEVLHPVTGPFTLDDDWSNVSASARVVHTLTDEINVFGGISQGFRAPNLSDLSRLDVARSGELETPVADLDPERFISLEIGSRGAFKDWEFEGAVFYTIIDDMIVRRPTGVIIGSSLEVTKSNAGDGFVMGIELGGRYRFTDVVSAWGNFVYMRGDVEQFPTSAPDSEKEPLSREQPATAIVGVRVEPKEIKLWVEGVVQMVNGAYRQNSSDNRDNQRIPAGGTPGYTIYGVRGGYHITEKITASCALENIGDKDFRVHGSGSNEPGTSVILALDVKW